MFAHTPDSDSAISAPVHGLAGIIPGGIEPERLSDPLLKRGLALWHELRGERRIPSRQQFSPRVLGNLLRHTILIKVLAESPEFQVRIMGDAILAVQTENFQGLTTRQIDQQLPGYGTMLHRMYSYACAVKQPLAFLGPMRREADQRLFHRGHLLVPLGESDEAVDHLISFVVYTQPPA
jgi:hypothetical protein